MKLDAEFNRLYPILENNCVFIRYGDGEVMLSSGVPVTQGTQAYITDRWYSKDATTKIGNELGSLLNNPKWYYGIPCQCCNIECKNLILSRLSSSSSDKISFANLFINGNYTKFKDWVTNINKRIIVIANERGVYKYPFKVEEILRLPDNCVYYWENNSQELIVQAEALAKKYSNTIFLFSGGPLKVLIKYMWEANPHNSYLDVGSAIDPWTYDKLTRPYQTGSGDYASRNCEF